MSIEINSESFEQWVKKLFECEYCAECGGDWYDHDPRIIFGNWFALCKIAENPQYKVRSREK